jgi:hypothetical protein
MVGALEGGRRPFRQVEEDGSVKARRAAVTESPVSPPVRALPVVRCRHGMLGQSVLLKGVNDDTETLGALMRPLVGVPH